MTEFQKEIIKAKKLFNIKDNNSVLNKRIAKVVNGFIKRNQNKKYEEIEAKTNEIQTKWYEIFYQLDNVKNDKNLTPFKLYKIFRLCLYGLDELLFFQDTVRNPKDFNEKKYESIMEKAKPFITNYEDMKVRIPKDPNEIYNDIYFTLLNEYKLKKEDVLNLLDTVYNKDRKPKDNPKKKAKIPKRKIEHLTHWRDNFYSIATQGGKEKGLSKEETQAEINEIDILFKDYIKPQK